MSCPRLEYKTPVTSIILLVLEGNWLLCCELLCGEAHKTRSWGRCPINRKGRTKTSVPWPVSNRILPANLWGSLEIDLTGHLPVEMAAPDDIVSPAFREIWARGRQLSCSWLSHPRNPETMNVCAFKPLNAGMLLKQQQ